MQGSNLKKAKNPISRSKTFISCIKIKDLTVKIDLNKHTHARRPTNITGCISVLEELGCTQIEELMFLILRNHFADREKREGERKHGRPLLGVQPYIGHLTLCLLFIDFGNSSCFFFSCQREKYGIRPHKNNSNSHQILIV